MAMHGFARNVRPAEARSRTSLMCPLATSQHLGENQTDYPTYVAQCLVPSSCADQGLG